MIIGCDYHPSWQQICWFDTATGETGERKLEHASGEAERFYRQLPAPALIGMESTGNCQWFVERATTLGHDVWIGDAARIRAAEVRQQKHDRRDAALILKLLMEGRFPRIWTPSGAEKDLRQLLIHRHKLVRIRAQVKTELQHLAMNQGVTKAEVVEQGGREGAPRVTAEAVGQPAAGRPVQGKRDVEWADYAARPSRGGSCGEKRKSAAADDAAGRGADHVDGVCADDGRCFSLPAREAGSELPWADSAGVQFRRASTAGID